ncbi:MAG: hypothetical protein HYR67_04215, partial [Bacteroidetes bacterium]|nr:hypothetical protein [Bacteroidota bacterium]
DSSLKQSTTKNVFTHRWATAHRLSSKINFIHTEQPNCLSGLMGSLQGFTDASGSLFWYDTFEEEIYRNYGEWGISTMISLGWNGPVAGVVPNGHGAVVNRMNGIRQQMQVERIVGSLQPEEITYLRAAATGEATPGLNDKSVNEMAQIIYTILNRVASNYNDNNNIEDVITDPGEINGIYTEGAQYILNGESGNEQFDIRGETAWNALAGVMTGDIPNQIGTSRFFGSINDLRTASSPFSNVRAFYEGAYYYGASIPSTFQYLRINDVVFFDYPGFRRWGY